MIANRHKQKRAANPARATHTPSPASFDLIRVTKAKEVVDVAPNTVRAYHRAGRLQLFYSGRACWFSKSELEAAIRAGIPSRRATEKEGA